MRIVAWPAFANKEVNPYNSLLYSALNNLGVNVIEAKRVANNPFIPFDILHLHWPEYPLSEGLPKLITGLIRVFALTLLAKMRGAKVVWTVHNLRPHERRWPKLEPLFYKWLVTVVDGAIFLSKRTAALVREDPLLRPLLHKPWVVIPHGHYRDAYPSPPSREKAREQLGLDDGARVLLFFGQMRPYKGIEQLMEAFRCVRDPDVRLLIAGKPSSPAYAECLRNRATEDHRIVFLPGFFAEREVPVFFAACDVVVLPYTSILNSGSVLLALSFEKPVLAARLGSLPEIAKGLEEGWVMLYDPPLTGEHLRKRLLTPPGSKELLERVLWELRWDRIAEGTLDFYRQVASCSSKVGGSPLR